jgi:hypothetical protein
MVGYDSMLEAAVARLDFTDHCSDSTAARSTLILVALARRAMRCHPFRVRFEASKIV